MTAGASGLWAVLAAWRPTTTWHLGPFMVAAAAPWALSRLGVVTARLRPTVLAAMAGWLCAVGMTVTLARLGFLRGPTLTGSGDTVAAVVLEASLLATVGALATVLVALVRDRSRARSVVAASGAGVSREKDERADV